MTNLSFKELEKRFELLVLGESDRECLSANVLMLSEGLVISDARSRCLNELLTSRGFRVVPLLNNQVTKLWDHFGIVYRLCAGVQP